jgi:hypothetical protein
MAIDEHTRFPLSWPTNWKRTPARARQRAAFMQSVNRTEQRQTTDGRLTNVTIKRAQQVSIPAATERLERQLALLGATQPVLSTNMPLRLDGRPRAEKDPDDPGAAVYFRLNGQPRCLACDRWARLADNIAALAQHVDAVRRIDRYGVGTLDQAFAGYAALPDNTARDWRTVFGFGDDTLPTWPDVEERFKAAARAAHPDAGGTHEQMARLTEAKAFARRELVG